ESSCALSSRGGAAGSSAVPPQKRIRANFLKHNFLTSPVSTPCFSPGAGGAGQRSRCVLVPSHSSRWPDFNDVRSMPVAGRAVAGPSVTAAALKTACRTLNFYRS
ncbi:hypothetical protein TcCL_NonESM04522, partial [Trypanosoma cruzi]